MPSVSGSIGLSVAELRDVVIVGCLVVICIAVAVALIRPRVAVPFAGPLEEQISIVRHRVNNIEQQIPHVGDHEVRLRALETEVGMVRAALASIREGQARNERMLEMLVNHHIPGGAAS